MQNMNTTTPRAYLKNPSHYRLFLPRLCKRAVNIFDHIQNSLSGGVCVILRRKPRILLLFISRDNSS